MDLGKRHFCGLMMHQNRQLVLKPLDGKKF